MLSETIRKALKRPPDYYKLENKEQYIIDQEIGPLDLMHLKCPNELKVLLEHHRDFLNKKVIAIFEKQVVELGGRVNRTTIPQHF